MRPEKGSNGPSSPLRPPCLQSTFFIFFGQFGALTVSSLTDYDLRFIRKAGSPEVRDLCGLDSSATQR